MVWRISMAGLAILLAGCGGRDRLLSDLQSPNPERRASAVSKLSRKGDAQDLVLFTRAAKDGTSFVRSEAAGALARFKEPSAAEALGDLLEDADPQVRTRAALALSHSENPKAIPLLLSHYSRGGRALRISIVRALGARNVQKPMAEAVAFEANVLWQENIRALRVGTLPEKVAAAQSLGRSGRPQAIDKLLELGNSPQVALAAAALKGLGQCGDPQVVGAVSLALGEGFSDLREAACEALGALRAPESLPALEQLALEQSAVSPAAVSALTAYPPSAERDKALCEVVFRGSRPEAWAAVRALGPSGCPLGDIVRRLAHPKDVPALLQGLQAAAVFGPSAAGALPKILPLLSHRDGRVRASALDAVAQVGDSSAASAVRSAYEGISKLPEARESAPVLAAALEAMGSVRIEGALDVLKKHLDDGNARIQTAAYDGLARLGGEGIDLAEGGFARMAADARGELAQKLWAQGAPGQRAVLSALQRLPDGRRSILEALGKFPLPPDAFPILRGIFEANGAEADLAAGLMAQFKTPEAREMLARSLDLPSSPARAQVLLALGEMGDASVSEKVAQHLYDDNPELRAAAIKALHKLGAKNHREELEALKGDYYLTVRSSAEDALKALDWPK